MKVIAPTSSMQNNRAATITTAHAKPPSYALSSSPAPEPEPRTYNHIRNSDISPTTKTRAAIPCSAFTKNAVQSSSSTSDAYFISTEAQTVVPRANQLWLLALNAKEWTRAQDEACIKYPYPPAVPAYFSSLCMRHDPEEARPKCGKEGNGNSNSRSKNQWITS